MDNPDHVLYSFGNRRSQSPRSSLAASGTILLLCVLTLTAPAWAAAPPMTISGRITFKGQDGSDHDARFVKVEVYEKQAIPGTDYKLAEGYTDGTGRFSFTQDTNGNPILNEDTAPGESGTRDIYIKCLAMNEAAKVSDNLVQGVLGVVYWVQSDVVYDVPAAFTQSFYIYQGAATPTHASAWFLPGELKSHRDWLASVTPFSYARPSVDVQYPDGSWPVSRDFTFYGFKLFDYMQIPETWAGNNILSRPSTVAHEYFHAVQRAIYGTLPSGASPQGLYDDPDYGTAQAGTGSHFAYSESSPQFAFVEGWAEFMQCLRYGNPMLSVYDLGKNSLWMGGDAQFTGGNINHNTGEIVEGAVASILWNLSHRGPDGSNGVGAEFAKVWTVFRNDKPTSIWNAQNNGDFYHYWNAGYGQSRAVDEIFIDHGVPVADDGYEPNNDAAHAAPLAALQASYPALILADAADWFRFDAPGIGAGSSISISFTRDRGELELRVYDQGMNEIGYGTELSGDLQTVTFNTDRPGGTFYIEVTGRGGDYSPHYNLDLAVSGGITIQSPNGGETWTVGTSATITWQSTGVSGNVDLDLSTDNGSSWPYSLASNTANDGTQSITVPNSPSTLCRVRIKPTGGSTPLATSSNTFTIASAGNNVPPSFLFMAPLSANELASDDVYMIKWIDADPDSNATIVLYADDDNDFNNGVKKLIGYTYEDPEGGGDMFAWFVPSDLPNGSYYVLARVDDGVNPELRVYSPGTIKVQHAAGGTDFELVRDSFKWDDDNGDNDPAYINGVPEGFETLGLFIPIRNKSSQALQYVRGTLSSTVGSISFSDDDVVYGTVAAGHTVARSETAGDPDFMFRISASYYVNASFSLLLEYQDSAGNRYQQTLPFTQTFPAQGTSSPSLAVGTITFDDTGTRGNGNGVFESGEYPHMYIQITNSGNAPCVRPQGTLTQQTTWGSEVFTSLTENYPDIPAGSSAQNSSHWGIYHAPYSFKGTISTTLRINYGPNRDKTVDLPVSFNVVGAPHLFAQPFTYDFGVVAPGVEAHSNLGIGNDGSTTLTVTSIAASAGDTTVTGMPGTPFTIAPGDSVNGVVRIGTGALNGAIERTVTVSGNALFNSPATVTVTGMVGAGGGEIMVAGGPSDQHYPHLYQDQLVYVDESVSQVFLKNLTTGSLTQLTNTSGVLYDWPRIYNRYVVWTQRPSPGTVHDCEIYLLNLDQPASPTRLTNNAVNDTWCRIWGDYVVWHERKDTGSPIYRDIMLYKISTGVTTQLTSSPTIDEKQPYIYGDYMIWYGYAGQNKIYQRRMSTGNVVEISRPSVYWVGSYDDKIVYVGDEDGEGEDVYLWNGGTPTNLSNDAGTRDEEEVVMWGNNVVYSTWREADGRLYRYELGVGGPNVFISDTAYKYDLSMYDKTVAWTDTRNGDSDIYIKSLIPDNLVISSNNISFSKTSPVESDQVIVTAVVQNTGQNDLINVRCRIYNGDPAANGVQIGSDVVVSSIAKGGSAQIQGTWQPDTAGTYTIYVVVDPLNAIPENNKLDNRASQAITVADNDTTGPEIVDITAEEAGGDNDGAIEDNEQVKTSWRAQDPSGVASCSLTIGGSTYPAVLSGERWSVTVGPFVAGVYAFTVTATDADNSPATTSVDGSVSVATHAPLVTAVSPASGATNVILMPTITATCNEDLDETTVIGTAVSVKDSAGNALSGQVSYDAPARMVTLLPDNALKSSMQYTVMLFAGSAGIKDKRGHSLEADYPWSFTTVSLPGYFRFSSSSYNVNENGGSVTISVQRTVDSGGAVSVSYATSDGSGAAGQAYSARSGTLSWADRETADKTFAVTILDNSVYQGNKTFNVSLSSPQGGAQLDTPNMATVLIADNEPALSEITSLLSANGTVDMAFSYTITASNNPSSFAASNLPGDLTLTASTGVISGIPRVAGLFHVGLTATNAGGVGPASTLDISIAKATPVITWGNPADIVYGTALSGTQLNATASVPGTLTYTPAGGTVLNAGLAQALHVDFVPTDTANYNNASKDVTINVLKATPVITWGNPADITYPTPLGATQLNATASVPGTLAYTPPAGTVLPVGAGQNLHVDFAPTDTANYNNASKDVTINVLASLTITARETQDANGNGRIDAIRIIANAPLNDNFAGLIITVAGYTVTGYDTGSGANDNEFFVRLAEGAAPDTGATPAVQVTAAGSLASQGGQALPVDAAPVTATDTAKPVLMSASWYDGSGAGVDAGDPIYLTFSEPVTSNNALAADFGLPVANDTYGAGATVSNGQNTTDPRIITITLQGDPLLTPGGVYSPGSLAAGSPTGIYVADGTRIVDAAGNSALVQTIGTAVDLQPGTEHVSICWDDLSIAPRTWNIGLSDPGATYQAFSYFPPNGLVARNNGNVREKFTMSCSTASPSGWAVATTAGQNQFEVKAANSGPPYVAYPWDLATGPKNIATQLYSGHNQAFDLRFTSPTSGTAGAGVGQTITVTITAAKD